MNLNEADYTLLIEAVESWMREDGLVGAFSDLAAGIILRDPEEAKRARSERLKEAQNTHAHREEIGTLLKAKLYQLRREAVARADLDQAPTRR